MSARRFLHRWLLAGFCVLAFVRFLPAAEKPVRIQIHWWPQAQFAGFLVAQEKGYYRQEGIPSVEVVPFTGGKMPFDRLKDRDVDFCTGWLSEAITLRARGVPLVNLSQFLSRSAFLFVARRSSGIRTPADMNGRRVGLWEGDFSVLPRVFFQRHGIKPVVVVQRYSIEPFLRGAVEVTSAMYYNEYHQLLEAGLRQEDLVVFHAADYGCNFPEDGLYCLVSTRTRDPELCRAVTAATLKGWRYARAHPDEALSIVMKYCDEYHMPTNRNHQRWMLRSMGTLMGSGTGNLERDTYDGAVGLLTGRRIITAAPSYDSFYRPAGAP